MKFGRKKYGTHLINTEGKKEFMHDMHKIFLDATFTQMTAKKGINRHNKREISDMYMDYTQIEDMKLIVGLQPHSDSGFTLVTHPLRYEPYNPTCVGSSVEILPLEHKIVTQRFHLLLYIYNL